MIRRFRKFARRRTTIKECGAGGRAHNAVAKLTAKARNALSISDCQSLDHFRRNEPTARALSLTTLRTGISPNCQTPFLLSHPTSTLLPFAVLSNDFESGYRDLKGTPFIRLHSLRCRSLRNGLFCHRLSRSKTLNRPLNRSQKCKDRFQRSKKFRVTFFRTLVTPPMSPQIKSPA